MPMTARRARGERSSVLIAAVALLAPLFVAGCSTPQTYFAWDYARDPQARPHPLPVKVNHVAAARPRCICQPVPVPTARPDWTDNAAKPAASVQQASLPPPSTARSDFTWPVHGRVIWEFGVREGGERNDGINIAVREGEPIRAAGDGTVTYEGDELKNYGNLVLIKHDNGYATVYAHAESFIVSKGQHVARGQVIGYGGSTGDVSTPQLHFEIRRGAREPVDPRTLLGPLQMASR